MRILFLLFSCVVASAGFAAQKAITDTGEEVILDSDGTWHYAEGVEPSTETIPLNEGRFTRPEGATFELKSVRNNAAFYLDTGRWSFMKAKDNGDAEYQLQLKGEDLYAMAITEKIEVPVESLADIALENARSVSPMVTVDKKEYRLVNGNKVIYMEFGGNIQGIDFTYMAYYYSDASGSTQYLTYTSSSLVEKYRKDAEALLNGLATQ